MNFSGFASKTIVLPAIFAASLLGACSEANASLSADDDRHCAALSFYWLNYAHQRGTKVQYLSAFTYYQWYGRKLGITDRTEKFAELVEAETKPLLEEIGTHKVGYRDVYADCVTRATDDPAFTAFVENEFKRLKGL